MLNYKFNQYRVSGEPVESWSPMAYRLVNKNAQSDSLNGFKVGHMLYLHHLKGMSAQEIRESSLGHGIAIATVKSVLKGFGRQSGVGALKAYDIAIYMIQNEPEVLEQMYKLTEYKM